MWVVCDLTGKSFSGAGKGTCNYSKLPSSTANFHFLIGTSPGFELPVVTKLVVKNFQKKLEKNFENFLQQIFWKIFQKNFPK
jgi:hypothetical protein